MQSDPSDLNAQREARAAAPASISHAPPLPAWFDAFLVNVCEIPDRNSPEDEPAAIVATLEELKSCALNAIENAAPLTREAATVPLGVDTVARLKHLLRRLDLENAVPPEILSDPEALFSIFGQMRSKLDRLTTTAASSPAVEAATVLHGWKLIPVEPTPEMILKGGVITLGKPMNERSVKTIYGAMLSVAPAYPADDSQPVRAVNSTSIKWPEGYCLCPDGKYEDWSLGYDLGYAEALSLKTNVVHEALDKLRVAPLPRASDAAPTNQRDEIEYAIQVLRQVEAGDGVFVGQCAEAISGLEGLIASQPVADDTGATLPRLHGVSRVVDNPCALMLFLKREPSDDDLRNIHEALDRATDTFTRDKHAT